MDQWLELPADPRRKAQAHRPERPLRAARLAAVVLALVCLLAAFVNGCGKRAPAELTGPETGPEDGAAPRAVALSLVPGAGRMHNLIVEKTLAALPALPTLSEGNVPTSQVREALRAATREALAEWSAGSSPRGAGPELAARLNELLDDAHLDLLEQRFRSLKILLTRAEIPPVSELEMLFESWGVEAAEAHRAAVFARLALSSEARAETGSSMASPTTSPEVSGADPASELRELAASSPTMGMVYELYRSSSSLWQSVSSQSSSKEEKLELTLTIVMDAEGGLGGLLFGPIGAILGSAVYSILWVATAP